MTTEIIHYFINTDFGTTLWDQIYEEDRLPQSEQTLLERLKLFLETQPLLENIIGKEQIMTGLARLGYHTKNIPNIPTWFLAEDGKNGVIGCVLSGSVEFSVKSCDWILMVLYENHLEQSPVLGEGYWANENYWANESYWANEVEYDL